MINKIGRLYESPYVNLLAKYFLLVLLVTLVLFWRYPNNVLFANFYAEDGSVFLQNILDKGWLQATLTPFNGYFIVGLYGISGVSWLINNFLGNGLLTLSSYFALASIVFMSAVICLPFLLFKKEFGPYKLLIVIVLSALLPLTTSPHIVLGTVGNQKWIFLYLAFQLVLYRIFNYKNLSVKKLLFIDLSLLVCAFTNSVTYGLIPILFIPYIRDALKSKKRLTFLRNLLNTTKNKEFLSLIILSILLLPQVIYIAVNGIPKLPGYLDSPYDTAKTIELFINRTFIFGITHGINGHMNNLLSILVFSILIILGWLKLRGKERVAFFIGIYSAGLASLLFVFNRPGVTDFFFNYSYKGSGPDQFFYTQTLIMYLPIVLVVSAFSRIITSKWIINSFFIVLLLFMIGTSLRSINLYGSQWRNASVFENSTNTFVDQSIVACKDRLKTLNITLYPYPDGRFQLHESRKNICTPELNKYQLSYNDLGLKPANNDYLVIKNDNEFYQSFKAEQNGLNGIRIFLSNFSNLNRSGDYSILLKDSSCKKLLAKSIIPNILMDNSYFNARFPSINSSLNKTYCFTLDAPDGNFDQIAIQQSSPNIYNKGVLMIGSQSQLRDIVFQPLYKQNKP